MTFKELGREDYGESGTMSHVIDGADFMFEEVGSPVLFTTYTTGSIVGDRSAPHQIGTGSVIFPAWMTWMTEHNVDKIAQYAIRVWGVEESDEKRR